MRATPRPARNRPFTLWLSRKGLKLKPRGMVLIFCPKAIRYFFERSSLCVSLMDTITSVFMARSRSIQMNIRDMAGLKYPSNTWP